ncbi:MAG: acyltransferase [Candidatus Micrarchaeia archaeon]
MAMEMRKVNAVRVRGWDECNSLNRWWEFKNPIMVVRNFAVIELAKILPSLRLKRWLLAAIGMKIGRNAAVGLGVQFDIFFPELIELGENCIVGYGATLLTHEFLIKELRIGKVVIGKNALVGANSTILPGVRIGENAVISACSLVNRDVPGGAFVCGVPARRRGRRSRER